MPSITVDGKTYQVEAGQNLLQTLLHLGLDLPYFCWHPAMGSIGACRQCAVIQYQNAEDTRGRIVMGCMTPVTDGAIFSLAGDRARQFREAIVESLMLNHPHDCPVCAEGGECHLQDMTVMVGHRDRHYRGRKNTHRNQYLGPLINHEMNRCITCYRCTRYYRDYAGGTDLAAMAAHDHIYFGRHQEGVLESPFAGNLVEVCPTGVFTDKLLVHSYTRKWDLQSAPSVCTGCAVGCNTMVGERYGKLKRIHNRFNHEVNGYFLCDRGRFGGGFVNDHQRMNHPGVRGPDGRFAAVDASQALAAVNRAAAGKTLAAIGSPRASVEANYLLRRWVGAGNFCTGMDSVEQGLILRALGHLGSSAAHNPSLCDMESADAVLVLGEDVTQTAPRIALALRQAVRNKAFALAAELKLEPWQDAAVRNLAQDQRSPLHIVAGHDTALDDVATSTHRLAPADQVSLAHSLVQLIREGSGEGELQAVADDLCRAERPLVLAGTSTLNSALIDAAAAIADALAARGRPVMLGYCLPECNSMGSALLGQADGCSLEALAERAARGEIGALVVMENELERRAEPALIKNLRDNIPCWVGMDCIETGTLGRCDIVLPSGAFTETEGTLVSSEGRAQRYFPVHTPAHGRRPDWQWLLDLAAACASEALDGLGHFDAITAACAEDCALLSGITAAAPDHDFRRRGLKIPRQPHRYSGRTAMNAGVSVHEPAQPADEESPLAYTMEGAAGVDQPGALLSYVWAPGWNSNQSLQKFQSEIGGPLRGGTAGKRLLDELKLDRPAAAAPSEERRSDAGELQLIARHRVFGSEELSALAPGIDELCGQAWLELNSREAAARGLASGDGVRVANTSLELCINDNLPDGCATFTAGFPSTLQLRSGSLQVLSGDPDWRRAPQVIGSDGGGRDG